tara:strand:- start:21901 stop:22023 length:123 start_codon:yes stop_codon:yes gene_type:complete
MSDLDNNENEDQEDSKADAIAATIIIAALTLAMYFWVSSQ